MTHQIEFTFGTGVEQSGEIIMPIRRVFLMRLIALHAIELFGGYTLHPTVGGWLDPRHQAVIEESSARLIIYTQRDATLDAKVLDMASFIKQQLNQASVYVTQQDVTVTEY